MLKHWRIGVHPECGHAVDITAALLDDLGHTVDVSWPPTLDHLWQRSYQSFRVVSDATRPPVLRWLEQRLGRPIRSAELETPPGERVSC
jgi:hypothetical protein